MNVGQHLRFITRRQRLQQVKKTVRQTWQTHALHEDIRAESNRVTLGGGMQSATVALYPEQDRIAAPQFPLSGMPMFITLGYLAMLIITETLTMLVMPQVGLLLYIGLLLYLLFLVAQWWETPLHRLLICLIFAPLIRMISLSMPLIGFPLTYWYLATSIPLFAAVFYAQHILNLSWREMGFQYGRGHPGFAMIVQTLIGLVGLIFGYTEYQILQPGSLVEELTWQQVWVPALVLMVCTGFFEELLFRGLMQRVAREMLGVWGSILLVSLIFAVLHIGYQSLTDLVFVFVAGVFFGVMFEWTHSLIGITIAHGLTNIMLFVVMPMRPDIFIDFAQLFSI
jgi:hypothetical protein